MAEGTLIHAGIAPRHAPRGIRLAREHQSIAQRTRPSARELFEARGLFGTTGFLPAIPSRHVHPRHLRGV